MIAAARAGSPTDERGLARPSDFAGIGNAAGGDGSDIGAVGRGSTGATCRRAHGRGLGGEEAEGHEAEGHRDLLEGLRADAEGKGKAGGDKFKTKSASLSLSAGVATKVKLKLKKGDRKDVAGEKGKATIAVNASAGAESATDSSKIKLKPWSLRVA